MIKHFSGLSGKCNTLLWLGLPLAFLAGCASDSGPVAAVRASPPESVAWQAVAYDSSSGPVPVRGGLRAATSVPDFALRNQVESEMFAMLMADMRITYSLSASVDKWGAVRLGGTSWNGLERQRLVDRMWELPGVTAVKDSGGLDVAHTVAGGSARD